MFEHVTIRLATRTDFPGVRAVLDSCELCGGLDLSDFSPVLVVAEDEGQIVGAAQVILGKPAGFLSFLGVLPAYRKTGLATRLNDTINVAAALLGSPTFSAVTDANDPTWGDTLDRYGLTTVLPNARLHRKG